MRTLRLGLPALLAAALALAACADQAPTAGFALDDDVAAQAANTRTFSVTIENLTAGQPFSPGVLVSHAGVIRLFEAGAAANPGIVAIAEGGDASVAADFLEGRRIVRDAFATAAPIGPGGMATFEIEADRRHRFFSFALMLVCTNDGFVGLDSVPFPQGDDPLVLDAHAYDAGSEVNDELSPSIVDGCGLGEDGNAGAAEGGVVGAHPGIAGGGDLDPGVHGWTGAPARVTIQRVQ